MLLFSKTESALRGLILATLALSLTIGLAAPEFFGSVYATEDGVIEYGTAVFLFFAAGVLAARAWRSQGYIAVLLGLYALLFFFAAGEEISWGQRFFGWQSSEFFLEHNFQDETTLHNLVVGGEQLANTLFGTGLTTMLLLYLIVLPLTYGRVTWITRLADAIATPVPSKRYALLATLSTVVVLVITASRKWEVYEFVFSVMALGIFILPRNHHLIGGDLDQPAPVRSQCGAPAE